MTVQKPSMWVVALVNGYMRGQWKDMIICIAATRLLKKAIDYGDRVHIKKSDITGMDGDGAFDIVRMSYSYEHVTNLEVVLDVNFRDN